MGYGIVFLSWVMFILPQKNNFVNFFTTIQGFIAPNVPAVYDVLPARIRALRSKDQGWQNVAKFWRGNGA
jgi:hypothetical protein